MSALPDLLLAPDAVRHAALASLCQGGDARTLQPYGLPVPAADELVHFGSCTANPVTWAMVDRHQRLGRERRWNEPAADIATDLRCLFGAAQCVLAASGTDAEYTVALAMGGVPFVSLLMDPNEIGSGCAHAAAGMPHVAGGPVEVPLALHVQLRTTRLRDDAGLALPVADVDAQVFEIAASRPALPLLLHHVPCTKTGLAAPSEAVCLALQADHPAGVRVVVDASQGRFSAGDIRRWLGHGWAVIVTGSKFFGAPPFCGATLFPAGWPPARGFAATPGLRARWRLVRDTLAQTLAEPLADALADLSKPAGSHSTVALRDRWADALMRDFIPHLSKHRIDGPSNGERSGVVPRVASGGAGRQGILSFDLGLDKGRATKLHRALIARGLFIGQPVSAGPRALLRVALGADLDLDAAGENLRRLARAIGAELRDG